MAEFIFWHYSTGLNQYLKRWYFLLTWVIHYFSLPLLLPSLFSPYKRLEDTDTTPGFSFERWFRQFTFNLISRGIGAIIRIFLFIFGVFTLLPCFLIGLIGLSFWLIFPPFGLIYYFSSDRHHSRFFNHLNDQLEGSSVEAAVKTVFSSLPGKFILTRSGIKLEDLLNFSPQSGQFRYPKISPQQFIDFLDPFFQAKVWVESDLKKIGLDYQDLKMASLWWDQINHSHPDPEEDTFHLSRPGLGLELLFGYTPELNKYSLDLSRPQSFTTHLIGREKLVSQIEQVLISGSSLILVGEPGVGKRTIVLELARRAMSGELDSSLIYKRFLELDYNFLLSDSLDINKKKTHLSDILSEATAAGNIILVIKDLHRLIHPDVEGVDFTDLFEDHLQRRKLKIIAISSRVDYERFLITNSRIRKYFQPVVAEAISKESAAEILYEYIYSLEKTNRVTFSIQSIRRILDGSDEYITDTPFPEKALELADYVIRFVKKRDSKYITCEDINTVLTDITGISLTYLTDKQRDLLVDLESSLHSTLVGQDSAVSLIAKSLRSRDLGVKNPNRPVGSFLFLGPTGVGKTQAAKTLAQIYFGSQESLIRFDMAEYAGTDGLSRLIGSQSANRPGRLTSAIHNKPASLLLLDEIEKAPPDVYNLFLSLLDEGQITDVFGKRISCRHLFVIATSNAGAEFIRQQVNAAVPVNVMQKNVLEHVQKSGLFSPEFINRFDGVVVFTPLDPKQLVDIARLALTDLAARLKNQNIELEITPEACAKIAQVGYEPQYGARPMRRVVDILIGDIIATGILKKEIGSGDKITLIPIPEEPYFTFQKI